MKIEDELRAYIVEGNTTSVVPTEIIKRAVAELEFLRSHAGAVTQGESFDDIARRVGRQNTKPDPDESYNDAMTGPRG